MASEPPEGPPRQQMPVPLATEVGRKEERKQQARQERSRTIWFGLGMFGLVGWSVAIPTLAGVALGAWLDKLVKGSISWTLTGLFVGVVLGCWNAWYWVKRAHNQG
jgi:ATP synthase protein I